MEKTRRALFCSLALGLASTPPLRADPSGPSDNASVSSTQAAALALAASALPSDHATLRQELLSEDFLARLGPPKTSRRSPQDSPLLPVLQTLSTNPAPSARQVLLALTQAASFNRNPDRTDLLIRACAALRPAPPEVVAFWDQHCQPEDGFTPLTIEALVENGSAPALALFEKKMLSNRFSDDVKTDWMRSSVLTHRNDLAVLQSCQRLLAGALPHKLRPALVEVFFDYKPAEWFPPDTVLRPPARAQAGTEARAQLRAIGMWALQNLSLTESEKSAIRQTLADQKKM
jgi:hypothetical protein